MLPEELEPFDENELDTRPPQRSLGVRLVALFVALTLVAMTVGVLIFNAGFLGIPL